MQSRLAPNSQSFQAGNTGMCHHVLAARFLKKILLFNYVNICVCRGRRNLCVCVSSEACGGHKRASDPLALELQVGPGN